MTDRSADAVVAEMRRALNTHDLQQMAAASISDGSPNAWFRGTWCGEQVFVKLFAQRVHAHAERTAARMLPRAVATDLLATGTIDEAADYCIYRWEALGRVEPDDRGFAQAGALLAAIHDTTPIGECGLSARPVGPGPFAATLARFAGAAPDAYETLRGFLGGRGVQELLEAAGEAAAASQQVLLHGDFSLRNLGRRHDGRPVVFDLERAELGAAELDLERIWDRELAHPGGTRQVFLDAYRCARGLSASWPSPILLDYARLHCALTTIRSARDSGDRGFEKEGWTMLLAVERGLHRR